MTDAWLTEQIARFELLLRDGESVLSTVHVDVEEARSQRNPTKYADRTLATSWRVRCVAAIDQVFGRDSDQFALYNEIFPISAWTPRAYWVEGSQGVIHGCLSELRNGYLTRVSESIRVETLSEFIGIARELYDRGENYVYAAASVAGAALEDHLCRQVMLRNPQASRPKSIASAAGILHQDKVMRDVERQSIGALEIIRNKADHGEWEAVTAAEIKQLIDGAEMYLARQFL